MNKAKKFYKVRVEVSEDFSRNGSTYGDSPIRVENGKVALAWNDRGCLEWWGNSSDVSDNETYDLEWTVHAILDNYLKNKPLWWWEKAFAAVDEKGAYDLCCRLPKRKGFCILAYIDSLDADELEDWPEDYADFVKFFGVEAENARDGEEEAE